MVIKSLTRKTQTYGQLLQYMLHDKDRVKNSFVITHNVPSSTVTAWEKAFKHNEANRLHQRANSVKLYHDIISFSNKDTNAITKELLQDIAYKYIELRNDSAMYVSVPHQDKDHIHLHFCISGTEISTGKANRISRERFREIKVELQQYQIEKYPELSNSIVNHDKSKKKEIISEKEFQLTKRTKQPSERERMKETLTALYKQSNSKEDFYKRIQDNGLKTYERGGKVYGIDGDRKMRFSTLGFDDKKIDTLDTTLEFEKIRDEATKEQEREKDTDSDDRELSDGEELEVEIK